MGKNDALLSALDENFGGSAMTIDKAELKALAMACKDHQPLRFMRSHGALYIRNDNGIVFDVHQNRSFPDLMAQNKDYADLVLAANPDAVLELLAESERLGGDLSHAVLLAENRQLKAENAGLKTGFEAYERVNAELKAECEALRKDAARYQWLRKPEAGGIEVVEWIGPHTASLTGDDLDALIDAALGKGEQS